MKSLKAKRIAAVAAGAALLGIGLAFAGPITFQNVPIINNAGQPVVQVVLGSSAKPADGVSAANIAAAIGNLAFTSVPVTASINASQAQSVLKPVVSTTGYTLANQQVYFNESSSSYVSGTYSFSALIGSVLNRAVKPSSYDALATKYLNSTTSAYPEQPATAGSSTATGVAPSAYNFVPGGVPTYSTPSSSNGGGVSFSTFSASASNVNYDNILRVTPSNLPSLLNSYGAGQESEYLWVTGFPVYDQNAGSFELKSAGGAYQAVFNKPISYRTGSNAINNTQISLLGQNWTILNYQMPGTTGFNSNTPASSYDVKSSNAINGGMVQLAASLTNVQTVFVGQNITSGPFKVELTDIGRTTNGLLPAAVNVYYNGGLINTTAITPPSIQKFNVSNHTIDVKVESTFAGYYAYTKYAKMQLYSNVMNITSGSVFNKTTNPGWYTELLWTNSSSTTAGIPNELQSIVVYNQTPTSLKPGQSFNFITSPSAYKLTFDGQSLTSSANYDALSFQTQPVSSVTYHNTGTSATNGPFNVTEPAQELVMKSTIPGAFTVAGQQSSTETFDLTPYAFTIGTSAGNVAENAIITDVYGGNFISPSSNLRLVIHGTNAAAQNITSSTLNFNQVNSSGVSIPQTFNTITSINITSRAVPGLTVKVVQSAATGNVLATLAPASTSPAILQLQSSGTTYLKTASGTYNQQNGQIGTAFALTSPSGVSSLSSTSVGQKQYAEFTINEYAVPSVGSSLDELAFGIDNNTNPSASNMFWMNYTDSGSTSAGTGNNATYFPTAYSVNGASATNPSTTGLNAPLGFYTERGSKVASMSSTALTLDMAKVADKLQFSVGPSNVTAVTLHQKMVGPVGIGQAIPGIPNVTVAAVNASVAVSGKNYSISGISNIVATPSVSSATEPVMLKNMTVAGSPSALVVLDSQANPSSNLILIGSGFVNTLSAQLQSSYNVSVTPTTQIDAAYGSNRILIAGYSANQTTAAANSFIQALYAKASTT